MSNHPVRPRQKLVALLLCVSFLAISLPAVPSSTQAQIPQDNSDSAEQADANHNFIPYISSQSEEAVTATVKPNIVFIITDDQPYHMQQFLPQTNALIGDQGITFTRAFAEDPLCCPSRTSVLTGQYARTHNNIGNGTPYGGAEVWRSRGGDQSTIATWLQGAGYRTGIFGKYMNAVHAIGQTVPPGWNDWQVFINGDISINGVGQDDGIDGEGYINYYLSDNGPYLTFLDSPEEYGTDVITARTLNFIRQTPANQPLFVYYSPRAPHTPSIPAPRHEGALGQLPLYRPPSYDETDVSDKPPWVRKLGRLTNEQKNKLDQLYVDMAESLQAVDEGVAAIVNELAQSGRLDNTILIFTSDHGYALGEHRYHSWKECIYEECIRVPLLVRAPGVTPRMDEHLISLADIAPTLAELAGITPPIAVDGRSFAPLLYNPQAAWRDTLLIESLGLDPDKERNVHGVRTERYLYAELQTGYAELYDLQTDPYQMTNLANNPAFAATINDLKDRLNSFKFATDLSLTQQLSASPALPDSDVTYTLTIRNNGPRAAHSITIQDLLPANLSFVSCTATGGGVCRGQDNDRKVLYLYLGVNETRTVNIVARVLPEVGNGTIINNSASLFAMTSTDPQPDNDSATTALTVGTAAPSAAIFTDGFERGNLSAWSNYSYDSGDLSAHATAAIVESWGVRALLDDNNPIGVRDEQPEGETRYHGRFYFDPNGVTMANDDNHVLFFGYSGAGTTRPVVRVELRFNSGNYQLRASLVNDGTTWRNSSWTALSDSIHFIELEWHAATAAGSNDGSLKFWVDDVLRANLTGVDNDTRRIDLVRLGAIAGIDAGTRGAYYFDAFESRRTSYIGAASNGPLIVNAAGESVVDETQLTAFTESDESDPEEAALTQEVLAEALAEEERGQNDSYELHFPFLMR